MKMSSEANIIRCAWRRWYEVVGERPSKPNRFALDWQNIDIYSLTCEARVLGSPTINLIGFAFIYTAFKRKLYKLNWKLESRFYQHFWFSLVYHVDSQSILGFVCVFFFLVITTLIGYAQKPTKNFVYFCCSLGDPYFQSNFSHCHMFIYAFNFPTVKLIGVLEPGKRNNLHKSIGRGKMAWELDSGTNANEQ